MPKSSNDNVVEMHGCIVCARTLNVLAVYSPSGRLVDCVVTSAGGRCLPGEGQALVACDTHSAAEIDAALMRWRTRNDERGKSADHETEED